MRGKPEEAGAGAAALQLEMSAAMGGHPSGSGAARSDRVVADVPFGGAGWQVAGSAGLVTGAGAGR